MPRPGKCHPRRPLARGADIGQALMSRKRGRSKEARHVRIYHAMMRTDAWRQLDANAIALYVLLSSRYGGAGSNNGRIAFSVREAAKALKIGKSTAALAFRILQELGFIVLETPGSFNRKVRHAHEWRLTEFASDTSDKFATRDYEQWRPVKIQNTVPQPGPMVRPAGHFGTSRRTEAA
jgi:hypothetical protein